MARRKFRSNQRHEPTTERSFQEYFLSTPAPATSRTELLRLIRGGEDTFLELKVKLSTPKNHAGNCCAGQHWRGVIVFGVNDQLRIEGVDNPESVQEELVRICREDIEPPLFSFVDRIAFDNGAALWRSTLKGSGVLIARTTAVFTCALATKNARLLLKKLAELLDETRPLTFENLPVLGATIKDIDEAHLWSFLREFEGDAFDNVRASGYPTAEVFERDLLMATQRAGELTPTVADYFCLVMASASQSSAAFADCGYALWW